MQSGEASTHREQLKVDKQDNNSIIRSPISTSMHFPKIGKNHLNIYNVLLLDFMPMKLCLKLARHTGKTKNRHQHTVCRSKIGHIGISQLPTRKKKYLPFRKLFCVSPNVSYAVSLSEASANIFCGQYSL